MGPLCAAIFFVVALSETERPEVWNRIALVLIGLTMTVFGGVFLTGPNRDGSGRGRVIYVIFFWFTAGALVGLVLDVVVR